MALETRVKEPLLEERLKRLRIISGDNISEVSINHAKNYGNGNKMDKK